MPLGTFFHQKILDILNIFLLSRIFSFRGSKEELIGRASPRAGSWLYQARSDEDMNNRTDINYIRGGGWGVPHTLYPN